MDILVEPRPRLLGRPDSRSTCSTASSASSSARWSACCPGIGPVSAMALLLPVTLSGTPESGIIMMAGIYYGSMYGGSTTSILVNIPGEAASVVTCIDGHEMAKQGRAGPALGIAALGSFVAGTFAIIALMLVAPIAGARGRRLRAGRVLQPHGAGPHHPELPDAGLDGQVAADGLRSASCSALIGIDQITAQPRLTFDRLELLDGVGLVPVVMGLFGVAEILTNLETGAEARSHLGAHRQSVAHARRLGRQQMADRARHRARLLPRHPARRRRGHRLLRLLRHREEAVARRRSASARAPSKAWRGPKPPTMRPPAAPSFRC